MSINSYRNISNPINSIISFIQYFVSSATIVVADKTKFDLNYLLSS